MSENSNPVDRREFFSLGWARASDISDARRSRRWIRPPHALPELDFLAACTRCGECVEACPHGVVFVLPATAGPHAADTPALDLLNRGCHLCEDMPCVAACETGALARNEEAGQSRPRLALAVVDTGLCLAHQGPECGACAHICPVPDALVWEGGVRPSIDPNVCTGCALCREACIVDPKAIRISACLVDGETMEAT